MTSSRSSHKQILKATGIVGGAQIIQILIRIARTKIIAVLLGPTGVGATGLYYSTLELVQRGTGLGLAFSAIRDVADAAGTGDQDRISRSIITLRRWVWLTGILGLLAVLIFRKSFSQYAFNDLAHSTDFLLLSLVPFFTALTGGQMAILRGVRRIGEMARAGVMGAASGFCITVPLYWIMGIRGIVPAMILSALAEFGLSCYYSRRVEITPVRMSWSEVVQGGGNMIRLGLYTVITSLATSGTLYLVRIYVSDKIGLDGVGQFQAAWNLSAIYVGLVLDAMGADYFPRLSAVNQDNAQVCRLVNEQTEIALLLASPLIIGMICFMDVIVAIFYSSKFGQCIDILLWQMLGNLFKVISVSMGFVMLAKNKGGWFIFTEFLWNVILLVTIGISWDKIGLESTGLAFVIGYFILAVVVYQVCRHLIDFRWSAKNRKMIILYTLLTLSAFVTIRYTHFSYRRMVGVVIFASSVLFSYYEMKKVIDLKTVKEKLLRAIGC